MTPETALKKQVEQVRFILEGISCLCAEGVEFMDKLQLAEVIQKETLKAIDLLRDVK